MEMTLVLTAPAHSRFSRLIRKNLAMAALGGSLLSASWWVDSYVLGGEAKPILPPYSVGCTRSDRPTTLIVTADEEKCSAFDSAKK